MTSSRSSFNDFFRYMFINPNLNNLSVVIVERRYVFTGCMVLIALSADDVACALWTMHSSAEFPQ